MRASQEAFELRRSLDGARGLRAGARRHLVGAEPRASGPLLREGRVTPAGIAALPPDLRATAARWSEQPQQAG